MTFWNTRGKTKSYLWASWLATKSASAGIVANVFQSSRGNCHTGAEWEEIVLVLTSIRSNPIHISHGICGCRNFSVSLNGKSDSWGSCSKLDATWEVVQSNKMFGSIDDPNIQPVVWLSSTFGVNDFHADLDPFGCQGFGPLPRKMIDRNAETILSNKRHPSVK